MRSRRLGNVWPHRIDTSNDHSAQNTVTVVRFSFVHCLTSYCAPRRSPPCWTPPEIRIGNGYALRRVGESLTNPESPRDNSPVLCGSGTSLDLFATENLRVSTAINYDGKASRQNPAPSRSCRDPRARTLSMKPSLWTLQLQMRGREPRDTEEAQDGDVAGLRSRRKADHELPRGKRPMERLIVPRCFGFATTAQGQPGCRSCSTRRRPGTQQMSVVLTTSEPVLITCC
jgi:hypothetical protein